MNEHEKTMSFPTLARVPTTNASTTYQRRRTLVRVGPLHSEGKQAGGGGGKPLRLGRLKSVYLCVCCACTPLGVNR